MLIRSATNADADAIRTLVFGVLGEYGLLAEHEGVDADLSDIEGNYIARGGLFDLVLDDAGQLIGTVGLYPRGDGVAELRKMYLVKIARGRGIGKMLLERVLGRARELGFARIELETSSKLVEAIGLYKRYGFQPFQPDHIACRCDQAWALDLNVEC
ncbi:MAG: GNAT family N-acetyltransferase [Phycisphaerales bacterium]|nr:GNAT family N-acetyltransferase [Phycisphaerales bacterium]